MKGGMTESSVKTIIQPKIKSIIIIGKIQYLFLTFKNSINSFIIIILNLYNSFYLDLYIQKFTYSSCSIEIIWINNYKIIVKLSYTIG